MSERKFTVHLYYLQHHHIILQNVHKARPFYNTLYTSDTVHHTSEPHEPPHAKRALSVVVA